MIVIICFKFVNMVLPDHYACCDTHAADAVSRASPRKTWIRSWE